MEHKIQLLDNETINKIAAGEVIENPRSIVKELVENSIDAAADEIIIDVKGGGKKLIRITDNGNGINRDEIEEAFKRHCTSKISNADDLNSLYTLGFRGEALASIAAVSKVEIISKTKEDTYGVKMIIDGGITVSKEDIGCPVGTTISVTDLFFNVPARKKFLKSDVSESSNINEIVSSLALSKQNISFKYINNGKIAFKTPKTAMFLNTISSLYDSDLYNSLTEVEYKTLDIEITGYTSNLNYYRGNRKNQLVFVNGRLIKHKRINYYIEAAYYTLLPKGKYPACFLKVNIDPALVDVNVHPAKTEVRFQNEELFLDEVKNAIYKALRSRSIVKEVKKETIMKEQNNIDVPLHLDDDDIIFENKSNNTIHTDCASDSTNKISAPKFDNTLNDDDIINAPIDYKSINTNKINEPIFSRELPDVEYKSNVASNESHDVDYGATKSQNINIVEIRGDIKIPQLDNFNNSVPYTYGNTEADKPAYVQESFVNDVTEEETDVRANKIKIPDLEIIGILFDTYIIGENKYNKEMYMIDQHAAHERINYEKFLKQYNDKNILQQELIAPEVINLSYEDYYMAVNNIDIFENMGLPIESFGNNTILISSIPVVFRLANINDLFYTVLDSIKNIKKSNLNSEIDKIIKNACVKSVKAGDKLHIEEIKTLIDELKNTDSPYTCPHGRPVIIKMTKYEIERMFERIQN